MSEKQKTVHPGRVLKKVLTMRGLSCRKLAKAIDVPPRRVIDIVGGALRVTPDSALRITKALGGKPEDWLQMQSAYDLRVARQKLRKTISKIVPLNVKAAA